jgi:hypothetical protein
MTHPNGPQRSPDPLPHALVALRTAALPKARPLPLMLAARTTASKPAGMQSLRFLDRLYVIFLDLLRCRPTLQHY